MGISMSKSSQSGSTLLDAGRAYNGVTENITTNSDNHAGKTTAVVKPYSEVATVHGDSKPDREKTNVVQILCAEDEDEDIDDDVLKNICETLDHGDSGIDLVNPLNAGTERVNANTRFRAQEEGLTGGVNTAAPVFIPTLSNKSALTTSGFSPHAVISIDNSPRHSDIEPDSFVTAERRHSKQDNSDQRLHNGVDTLKDVAENHKLETDEELDENIQQEIEELLAIDVDISPRSNNSGIVQSPRSMGDVTENTGEEQVCADFLADVRKRIKSHGFYEKFPAPGVISEAQRLYRKLDLPAPVDAEGNILPHPPKYTKQEIFTTKEFGSNEIDFRILNAPETLVQESQMLEAPESLVTDSKPSEVVTYLCKGLEDNVDKVRAISTWLAVRQIQKAGGQKPGSDAADKWCKTFRTMCRSCQIKTKLIEGIIRSPKYLPGEDLTEHHRDCWTAVLVNSTWWIVDPVLRKSLSDDFAETANKHLTAPADSSASPGLFNHTESFFLDPEQFIFSHYPDEKQWQLLARPVLQDELSELAVLRHGYFTLGMKVISQAKSVIVMDKEDVTVSLGFPENTLRQFMCKLFYCGTSGLESDVNLQRVGSVALKRYVFTETNLNKHQVNIKVRLPKKGSYVLDIFGCSDCHPWQKVITYKLLCEQFTTSSSYPVNARDEWGPGVDAHAMGLSPLSHYGGEIIIDKVVTQISFKDKNGLQFKYELVQDNEKVDTDQIKLSFLRDKGQDVVFIMDMEPKLLGTYILQLSARSDTSKPFVNFCNYLMKKVECVKDRKNAIPRFDFTVPTEQKTVHKVPETGRMLLELEIPNVRDVNVKFKLHDRGELNFCEHARGWFEEDHVFVDLNFPRKGKYSVKIQVKTPSEPRFKTVREEHFMAEIPSIKWSPFPKAEPGWTSEYKLEEPLNHHLEEKEDEPFTVCMKQVQDVAVLAAGGWYHLDQVEEGIWKGTVFTGPRATRCRLLARFEVGSDKFTELLLFKVMAEEDFFKMEDRQDTLRENAFKDRRNQR